MIARIHGRLLDVDGTYLTVDVGGVGYEIEVSAGVLQGAIAVGEPVTLHTHFVVREDAQLLFGFASKAERDLFRAFVKLNGVGPKLALALISSLDMTTLAAAVRNNDVGLLTKVPGVGKKTAERLMLEMKSRLDMLTEAGGVPLSVVSIDTSVTGMAVASEAEDALIALGYKPPEAAHAIAQVLAGSDADEHTVETLVRDALRSFAKASSS